MKTIRRIQTVLALALTITALGCSHSRSEIASTPQPLVDPQLPGRDVTVSIESQLGQVAFDAAAAIVHIDSVVLSDDQPAAAAAGKRELLHSMGTGVLISERGLVLTNEHVVRNAVEIRIVLDDGTILPVQRVATDWQFDLALLEVDAPAALALLPHAVRPTVGSAVVAIGRDEAQAPIRIAAGVVTHTAASLQQALGPAETRDYQSLIESTAPILHGFSGGPLLDLQGRFVGLNVAIGGRDGVRRSYALPFSPQVRHAIRRMALQMRTFEPRAGRHAETVVSLTPR